MDGLIVMVALAVLAVPVLLIVSLVGQAGLRGRLTAAETKIVRLQDALEQVGKGQHPVRPLSAPRLQLPNRPILLQKQNRPRR